MAKNPILSSRYNLFSLCQMPLMCGRRPLMQVRCTEPVKRENFRQSSLQFIGFVLSGNLIIISLQSCWEGERFCAASRSVVMLGADGPFLEALPDDGLLIWCRMMHQKIADSPGPLFDSLRALILSTFCFYLSAWFVAGKSFSEISSARTHKDT